MLAGFDRAFAIITSMIVTGAVMGVCLGYLTLARRKLGYSGARPTALPFTLGFAMVYGGAVCLVARLLEEAVVTPAHIAVAAASIFAASLGPTEATRAATALANAAPSEGL